MALSLTLTRHPNSVPAHDLVSQRRISAPHNNVVLHGRVDRRKADAIAAALKKARVARLGAHWMKGDRGIITEKSREMICDLVGFKVAPSNMDGVIHTMAQVFGIELQDHISARQFGRIVEEGRIASDIQEAMEIRDAKAFARSGDGTTIRHINYEAKHARTIELGKRRAAQALKGWQATINISLVDTYNACPLDVTSVVPS
ncbi:hypothetical protein C8J57DRAFT_1594223 [Mycena rebaudengoi]|nr:hypothetical protein C8J57DRAFT_1594223 [Mycena rebaudengoi]